MPEQTTAVQKKFIAIGSAVRTETRSYWILVSRDGDYECYSS